MDDPLRRTFRVERQGIVGALVPRREGAWWAFLLRRPGEEAYRRVAAWHAVGPGDEVVACLVDPSRPDELQRLNALYSDTWYVRDEWRSAQHPWDDERAAFAEWVPARGARVLEICCGSGRTAPALLRDGNRVVGLDLAAPSLVEAAKTAPPGLSYVRGDATALPFADAVFDVVLCLENSLGEFLTDPLAPLVEMIRVCRAGGKAIVALREGEDPWVSWSPDGFVHVVRTFPPERRAAFLDEAKTHPRVAEVATREGDERPWGGRVWHAALSIR